MYLGWETKVRSERRMGEMLANSDVAKKNGKLKLHNETLNLDDLGITKIQSFRYQQLADIPRESFDRRIEEWKRSISKYYTFAT
jgi:hypothetical protein